MTATDRTPLQRASFAVLSQHFGEASAEAALADESRLVKIIGHACSIAEGSTSRLPPTILQNELAWAVVRLAEMTFRLQEDAYVAHDSKLGGMLRAVDRNIGVES